MATANKRRRSPLLWLAGTALVLLALWAAFGATAIGYARAGTAYGARVACSCRFVAGRSLTDCAKDKVGGMELVTLSEDDAARSVTARMLLITDTAAYKPGYGCMLQPWTH